MLVLLTSFYLHFIPPMHEDAVVTAVPLILAQQQDLGEQLAALDKLMRGKDNHVEVLESIGRLRVTTVVLRNQLHAAENPGDEYSKSEIKKIIKSLRRDLAKISDNLMGVILHPRRKNITSDNMLIWQSAARSLGQLGEFGAHNLWQIFSKTKKFRDEVDFLKLCLVEIGTTKDYTKTTDLVDLLDNSEFLYIAGAAEALAQFGDAPGKQRRSAVEVLSKYVSQYYENIQSSPSDEELKRKYRICSQPMIKALTALTGQRIVRPLEWTTWWNENKNKSDLWQDKDE